MSIHDRVLIIISSLTLILGGVSLVSYAQKKITLTIETTQPIINTITYLGSGENNNQKEYPLFTTNAFLTTYIDTINETGNKKRDYDFTSDDSIERYVSRRQSFTDKKYIPSDLVTIEDDNLIITQKNMQLRTEAASSLSTLAQEFQETFAKKLVIVSAYRSYNYQKNLKDKGCSDTLCAPAGHSEHQGGLAIDLFAATTAGNFLSKADFKKYYLRLSENAHRYGRHNTYQKGIKIDSYQPEPRHRRYVGRELATELYEQKLTLGEWVKNKTL